MPFVTRDQEGHIRGIFAVSQFDGQEFMEGDVELWEPDLTPLQKLQKLDADNQITQRNLRQFILLTVEAFKSGEPLDLSVIPGVRDVATVEATAEGIRAQIRALP
jgi:hypothetical protein